MRAELDALKAQIAEVASMPMAEVRQKLTETFDNLGVKDFDEMTEKFCEHRDARRHLQDRIAKTEKFMTEYPGVWESDPVGEHRSLEGAAGDICSGLVAWKQMRKSDLDQMFSAMRERDIANDMAMRAREAEKRAFTKIAELSEDIRDYERSFELYSRVSMALMAAYKQENPDVDELTWPNARDVLTWANDKILAQKKLLDESVFSCPGCGRHDFGLFSGQIKEACGPCRQRAEDAERRLQEAMNVIDDITRRPSDLQKLATHIEERKKFVLRAQAAEGYLKTCKDKLETAEDLLRASSKKIYEMTGDLGVSEKTFLDQVDRFFSE